MNCPACAHENRPGAKFCEDCAAPLPRACASCGAELRPNAKFCDECGTAAGAAAAPRPAESAGARKVVTIVFADLVGSTALHERLDPESARRFMERYYAAMRGAVESHGGTVTQLLGDGVKAVFGIPRVAEDDAIRAVRAAVAMQESFRALAEQQRDAVGKTGLRVAVNSGEVVANDASEIIGDPVNVAARLQEQGRDGDVVIGESTQRLVGRLVTLDPLGSFALKGRSEAVSAWRVTSLDRPVGATAAPFVGREDELARISSVYETAVATPAAALAVLLGSPGLGKSRLIDELARRLGDGATVIRANCDAAGGASFAPLADALRALPDLDAVVSAGDADHARILAGVRALLAGSPSSPEETFFVVRRLLSALASTKPVVLVIDDLHWAEPLLLDLIEHLVQWGSGVPLLVLVGARPELREVRSTLVSPGGLVSEVVTLAGLDAGAAMRLAANVIGAADLPAAVAAKVLATSEGNPLFVGELVRMLVHEGALRREGERWTAGTALAELEMPPTIHALLAARIERLRPEERIVLERAAVIGRAFSRSAVAELLPTDVTDLDARLESLRRGELIERDAGWFLGEPLLRFHHVLIRDAAYRRILKGTRAELHARFADWIEARAGESIEHDETIGWHLEQAHQHLRELGPIDERGLALGERAAQHLAAAGRRALARDDVRLASGLLGRALDRLDPDDVARAELALDWCEALLAAGDVGPATAALGELDRFAVSDARLRAWHTCFAGQLTVLTAPQGLSAAAESVATAARDLVALGDVAGEAKAHFVHAQAFQRLGKVGACEAALDRALAAARRAGDRRRANTVLAVAPLAALWGPSPVTRASGRCLDVVRVLRITQGAPAVEAVALSCQGVLEALRGRTDAARRMIASARKMVEELGITQRLLEADVFAARIDLLDGDAAAAERGLRAAYEGLRELGLGIDAARAAALLARALLALDRAAEAEALTRESERLAGDDLQAAIAWRGARAEALARRGETVEAVALATRAVEIATATDALLDHADARLALAAALRAAGRKGEADIEEARATELWEAKGATLLAERAPRASPQPGAAATQPEARVESKRSARLRARANRATATGARVEVAIATRDVAALERLFADPLVVVHHPTGAMYGRREQLSTWKSIFRAEHLTYRREVVATLGDSLELWRHWISLSGLSDKYAAAFGLSDFEELVLGEDDGSGRHGRFEIFASDQLGQAIARLYERHAELLPHGATRVRATGIARAAGVMLGQPDLAATATILAPDVEFSDLRTVGFGAVRGAEAVLQKINAMMELSRDDDARIEDVLALEPDALIVRWTNRGTSIDTGGAFERNLCQLWTFDSAGLLSRWQQFEAEQGEAAIARFEALTAEPAMRPRRRVRENAATRNAERLRAATNARDVEALKAAHAANVEVIHQTQNPNFVYESLATLGESLALLRRSYTHDGSDSTFGSVGAAEADYFVLSEVDDRGLAKRSEVFAGDRLGAAIARLYERYAEVLGESEPRERAATTARALAVLEGPADLDMWAAAMAPEMEQIDHRLLSTWSARGAAEVLGHLRALREVSDGAVRVEDVLAASSDLLLISQTNAGTDRVSGGRYERVFLSLVAFARDGRIASFEFFEPDRADDAFARFDALVPGLQPKASIRGRVRSNFTSANTARFDAAIAARDLGAVQALMAPEFEGIHHPTGWVSGQEGPLAIWGALLRGRDPQVSHQALATLGDSLGLYSQRRSTSAIVEGESIDVGASVVDDLILLEVKPDGLTRRVEVFASDHLGDAIARMYERHAELLPEGRARDRAETTARAVAFMLTTSTVSDLSALYAPTYEDIDHRSVGYGSLHRDQAKRLLDSWRELADDARLRVDDILALSHDGLVRTTTTSGVWREGGGAFERTVCTLSVFDPDGRVVRHETFDPDRQVEALARFDALVGGVGVEPAPEPFANAASLSDALLMRRFNERDWAGVEAMAAPELVFDERRRMTRNTCGREIWLQQFRVVFDLPASRFASRLLATRGERLSLNLHHFSAEVADGGGPLEMEEHFALHEVDRAGRIVAIVLFDQQDLDAAHAELDARFAAGEASACPRVIGALDRARLMKARGWRPTTAGHAPEFVFRDHRVLGWGVEASDSQSFVRAQQALRELSPDARVRDDHVRISARGVFRHTTLFGTRDGGAFETPILAVAELDEQGSIERFDAYDIDDLPRAQARFAELAAATPTPELFANAASRLVERGVGRSWAARDWDGIVAEISPAMRMYDRRRMMRLEIGYEDFLAQFRMIFDQPGSRARETLVATRGDRLALHRTTFEAEVEAGGSPLAFDEHLRLSEVDAQGRWIASVTFDLADVDAAYAELDARYEAGEDKTHAVYATIMRPFARAVETRNWTPLLALCAPTVVEYDNRGLAVLGTTRGADAWLENFRVLGELAPDARYRVDHFRSCARGLCTVGVWHGTREGGPFEMPLVAVLELDRQKRIVRGDIFDTDQLDRARARFDELAAPAAAPRPRFENRATRTVDRATAAQASRDIERFGAFFASDFRNYDRRALVQLETDREQFLAGHRQIIEMTSSQPTRDVLATRGDRLALVQVAWLGTGGDIGPSEIDWLLVVEVNARGDHIAAVTFEPGDLDAAYAELDARFATGEGALHPIASAWLAAYLACFEARDWDAATALFSPELTGHNHRLVGWGTLRDAAALISTMRAQIELAPDTQERVDHVRTCEGGILWESAWHGTREGGPFENLWIVAVELDAAGRARRVDVWEAEQLDRALARFEELRPDPLRIPPNMATRLSDRAALAIAAGDRASLRAFASSDFRFEDRGKRALVSGDVEVWQDSALFLASEQRARLEPVLLATIGDRIAVYRDAWSGSTEGGDFELGGIRVFEADDEGKLRALLLFDSEDRTAAFDQALARFTSAEAAACVAIVILGAFLRAINQRDWGALREAFTADFALTDQRSLGLGVLDRDAWIASLQATVALSVELAFEVVQVLAWNAYGVVAKLRRYGSMPEGGGPFENFPIGVSMNRGDRISRYELFGDADAERAIARFAELCAAIES